MMYLARHATSEDIVRLLVLKETYFRESNYRDFTWRSDKTLDYFQQTLAHPEVDVAVVCGADGKLAGYAVVSYDSPFMTEEIAVLSYFYTLPEHRNRVCSQILLDFVVELCEHRGAKSGYASSTAGFSDNGVNERAFRMFLKRNGFNHIGSFLVREF